MQDRQAIVDPPSERRRIDIGRLVAVAIFVMLMSANISTLLTAMPDHGSVHIVETAARVLTITFFGMLAFAYLRRGPALKTDRDWRAWLVALLGTATPLFIPLVASDQRGATPMGIAGLVVLVIGLVAMIWALGSLGTNISVVPQARSVVTHGAYARVRHPLYSAELTNVLGLCLTFTGALPWVAFVLLILFQYFRARREEAFLSKELPGYVDYMKRTPMLVPRLGPL